MATDMNRRSVLAGLSASVMLATSGRSRASEGAVELKVSTFVPGQDAILDVVRTWADGVEQRSRGRLRFVYFPSSQMGPPDRQFDLARKGAADVSLFLHGFTPGRFPLTELAYLPGTFGTIDSEAGAAALSALSAEFLGSEHAGTKLLAIAPTPEARIFSTGRFAGWEALAGRRIRHSSATTADTLRALRAVPVGVPSPEMVDALQKGLVDGLAINWQAAADWRVEEVGRQLLDVPLGAATFGIVMNSARYEALPVALRSLIDESALGLSQALGRELGAAERHAAERLRPLFEVATLQDADLAQAHAILDARRNVRIAAAQARGLPASAFYERLIDRVRSSAEART